VAGSQLRTREGGADQRGQQLERLHILMGERAPLRAIDAQRSGGRAPRRERDDESGSLVRKFVLYGSSPRGLQSLILAAKARALLSGRPNVSFEDLRAMLPPSLCHRLILNLEADAEGINAGKILDEILTQVPEVI